MNFYSMTNKAIAEALGQRIEQLRLEQNRTQQQIADEVGLSRVSYRKLVTGQAKFENIIAVLRVLGKLDLVEQFIPEVTFSPMEQLKLQGKKRRRAKSATTSKSNIKQGSMSDKLVDKELDW
ncbi:MAG: helix-turn-helix transcriptional regulator [Gammaproteobacteria bacterium]|nr:helix-turn-helix transcriptional regulator [Gammaproteobacteria bacterium]